MVFYTDPRGYPQAYDNPMYNLQQPDRYYELQSETQGYSRGYDNPTNNPRTPEAINCEYVKNTTELFWLQYVARCTKCKNN